MKVSVLISEGVKQLILTPETEHEKMALKLIDPDDKIHTVVKRGSFVGESPKVLGYNVYECQGGYFRAEENFESIMFVITPEKKEEENE